MPFREIAFALGYNLATIPWLYGRLTLPGILRRYARWTESDQERSVTAVLRTPFYNRSFHPYQARLVNRMLSHLDRIRERIAHLVGIYLDALKGTRVQTLLPTERDDGALLRFPIAVPGATRADFLRRALARGVFLETNYERLLAEPPSSHSRYPNSLWAADNVVLLPLYGRLPPAAARRIAQQVAEIADEFA